MGVCRAIRTKPAVPHFSVVSPLVSLYFLCCRGKPITHRLIPTMDQVLQRMEKAEGIVKKIKKKKRKSSTYAHVRKKQTKQAADAQRSGVREETKKIRNEEMEELSTAPAAGGDSLLAAVSLADSSSSVSSEDLDALMCT